MFPSPQAALPLPKHPTLQSFIQVAEDLTQACESPHPEYLRSWAEAWVRSLVRQSGLVISRSLPVRVESWIDDIEGFARRKLRHDKSASGTPVLADAESMIAQSHGFDTWPIFVQHLEALVRTTSSVARFEFAVDAIVSGDAPTLRRLLGEEPELIYARSLRKHGATLLHYISANGVEGYRQKTPDNIVAIAEMLLQAGARVDAAADLYDVVDCTTLGLVATSIHPEKAGVQEALLELLIKHGANLSQPRTVLACLSNGRSKAAEFLARNGASLDLAEAAGLGNITLVQKLAPAAAPDQMSDSLLYASRYGRTNVVAFLLGNGVDPAGQDSFGQTALHYACMGSHLEAVELLLKHNPPLEATNAYGGTVLGQTLWLAAHDDNPDRFVSTIEMLLASGARVPENLSPIGKKIERMLEDARADKSRQDS